MEKNQSIAMVHFLIPKLMIGIFFAQSNPKFQTAIASYRARPLLSHDESSTKTAAGGNFRRLIKVNGKSKSMPMMVAPLCDLGEQ